MKPWQKWTIFIAAGLGMCAVLAVAIHAVFGHGSHAERVLIPFSGVLVGAAQTHFFYPWLVRAQRSGTE